MEWTETWDRAVSEVIPAEATHVGLIVFDNKGQIRGRIPKPPADGVTLTFPRIKRVKQETIARTLQRVVEEQIGSDLRGCYPLEGLYKTQNSATFYFVATPLHTSPDSWSEGLAWLPFEALQAQLEASDNPASRTRDLKALADSLLVCPCPWRRILLMVRELHLLGYERFRACPYNYPLAWRCPVVPKHWVEKRHGGMVASVASYFPMSHSLCWTYTGAALQQPFDWEDALFDTPLQLAQRFLNAFNEFKAAGWGKDEAYVTWFANMLRMVVLFVKTAV
jgi:hypothetical protein